MTPTYGDPEPAPPARDRSFSLTAGGPFYRVLVYLRLRTATTMTRCWWIGILVWLPIVLGEGVRRMRGIPYDPALLDLSLHVRLLFALPLMLVAERLLEQTASSAMRSMYVGNFTERAGLDVIVDSAERLRASWKVELVLLAIAVLGGQLVFWNVFGATGLFHGGAAAELLTFPRVWYALVALPLVQFVMFRWMWRWLIWSYVVARISRLPLFLLATHGDFAAGLTALARPVTAFTRFVLALAAILSAAWETQLLHARTTTTALLPMVTVYLVAALAIAVGPLLLLSGRLAGSRRRSLAQYGDFMRRFALQFHAKWIEHHPLSTAEALVAPDMSALHDLGETFQVISKTRVFVFSPRTVFTVWFAGLLPMVPLFVSTLTVEQVLQRIVRTVLGGLPL